MCCFAFLGQCLDDTFSVIGSFKTFVPVICGNITGEHSMYLFFLSFLGWMDRNIL